MESASVVTLHPSGVVVDPRARVVHRPDGTVELSEREANLLAYLAGRAGEVVGRNELLRDVWRVRPSTRTRALDMCVRRVRERIEVDPENPRHLLTVRGTGYRFLTGPSDPTRAPTPPDASSNLPEDVGPLVGRQADLERLTSLFQAGWRLITVVGAAGVGKSRLVREWARRNPRPGTIRWVDLGEEDTADGMLRVIAQTLESDIGHLGNERLVAAVAARGALVLVLDAAEGCADPMAVLAPQLLEGAPELTIVATSRRPLHAVDETVFRLEPMPATDALALLQARVDAPLPPMAAALIGHLQGLPLTIELAASRLRLYSCAELVERLEASDLGRATGPDRHAWLQRALLLWWQVLEPEEHRLLGQLAVFRGGFTLEAAWAVLDAPDAKDRVQALVDLALLRSERTVGRSRRLRFRMFDCVRELALERADPAETERALERHAAWFLALSGPLWPPRLPIASEDRWIDDTANVVAATERALTRWPERAIVGLLRLWQPVLMTDIGTLLRLAEEVAPVVSEALRPLAELVQADALRFCGRPADADHRYRQALALAQRCAPHVVPWAKQMLASSLYDDVTTRDEALRLNAEALSEARETGDLRCQAYVLRRRGERWMAGDTEDALAEALALYRQCGDPYGELLTEIASGNERARTGRPAADRMARVCADWSARSLQVLPELVLRSVAIAFYLEDQLLEARQWALRYLDRVERQGSVYSVPVGYELYGVMELQLGHLDAARSAFAKVLTAVATWDEFRGHTLRASAHMGLGIVALAERKVAQARAHFRLAADGPEQPAIAAGLWALAGGGVEARDRLAALHARGVPLVDVADALADLHAGGAQRLQRMFADDGRDRPYGEVSGRRLARTAAELLGP
jgi:DNA-binding winged helix-turn-helix (wHTH) protein/predicted ATPase